MILDAKDILLLIAREWSISPPLENIDYGFETIPLSEEGFDEGFERIEDTSNSSTVSLQLDEFNPMHPDYQIVFINRPERLIPVAPNVVKHEMDVLVQIFTKLIRYKPENIDSIYRPAILAMKNELTRIFNANRYNVVGTEATLNHSSFVDSKFPHGYGTDPEPIVYVSSCVVQIHFYEGLEDVDTDVRVSEVRIMDGDLLGVTDVQYVDTDPWQPQQVPKGPLLEQHLLGPHVTGTIRCHDFNSIHIQLFTIPITEDGNTYPVNSNNTKTVFSTDIPSNPQFIVYFKDSSGNETRFNFYNVRIQKIELSRGSTSGYVPLEWVIHWMADYYYIGVPE